MTISGVYKLTFSSGNTYIGKSIDIDNRWRQHSEKFAKGTAASNMQAEFNRYGYPNGSIMFKCHADHIDVVEACFINRFKPVLNGTYPEDPFKGIQDEDFDHIMSRLHLSTVEHIRLIDSLDYLTGNITKNLVEVKERIEELEKHRTIEEIRADLRNKLSNYSDTVITQQAKIDKLTKDLAYANSSWWNRIFR